MGQLVLKWAASFKASQVLNQATTFILVTALLELSHTTGMWSMQCCGVNGHIVNTVNVVIPSLLIVRQNITG